VKDPKLIQGADAQSQRNRAAAGSDPDPIRIGFVRVKLFDELRTPYFTAMRRRLALGITALTFVGCAKEAAQSTKVEVGSPAPAYSAKTMTGDAVTLASMQPKVVLMNVWATWCGPCRKEIPQLIDLHAKYKDRGLQIVGISVDADGSDDAIRKFVADAKMDYTIWKDPDDRVQTTFLMSGVPATFLVDRKGVLRWKTTGALEPGDSTLTAAIERALGDR
jgi:thiol-disulfide isomerase/thioredoxin